METKKATDRKTRKLKKAEAFLALVKSKAAEDKPPVTNSETMEQEELISAAGDSDNHLETSKKDVREQIPEDSASGVKKEHKLSADVFNEMKKILREKNKLAMQRPKVFLTPDETLPYKVEEGENIPPPLFTLDLQQLFLFALQGNVCAFKPRWCKLLRVTKVASVVFICLDGVGYSDFIDGKENFEFIAQTFQMHVEMVCPEQYASSVDAEIYSVPMSVSQVKKANVRVREDIRKEVAAKIKPAPKSKDNPSSSQDKISRVCLLLSSHQMKTEAYPLPVKTADDQYKDFVFSKDHYIQVTPESPLFALDCEMCLTTIHKNELTRVSIIAENGETIYDTLVKPKNRIVNYLTRYSGITKAMLDPVTTTLEDVQKKIKEILPPDAILCGQSLNCDLIALKLFHPYVIDTSVIFNLSGHRKTKAGLRKLTGYFLNRTIQNSDVDGHCSVEDAKATLDLVKLKLQKGLEFGDATISGIYFPSVETYFLGKEDGSNATVENVEGEPPESEGLLANGHNDTDPIPQTSPNSLKRPHSSASDDPDAKKIKILNKNKLSQASLKQIAIFNQRNSAHVHQSFFKLVSEAGREGKFIGREPLTSKYEKEPIRISCASCDKEVCKQAKEAVETEFFTWVNFKKFRNAVDDPESSEERLESVKQKMDKYVKEVVSKVKEQSLLVVMMTGRQTEGNVANAGVFMKIT